MKVHIDSAKCQGHARCHAICPDLFAIDDADGKSRVKVDTVPGTLQRLAERAADNCPEGAITLDD